MGYFSCLSFPHPFKQKKTNKRQCVVKRVEPFYQRFQENMIWISRKPIGPNAILSILHTLPK